MISVSEKVKPALLISQQIELLKEKGLKFHNEQLAYCILQHNNYYRLRDYFIDFYKKDNVFIENTYFENCIKNYA